MTDRKHPAFIWTQSPNDPTLRRTSFIVPGYGRRDTDQGIHHDEWHYVISDGAHALSFHRGTNDYPPTVKGMYSWSPSNQMFLHSSEPMTDEQIRGEEKADEALEGEGGGCQFVEGGKCFNAGSWLSYADTVAMRLSREGWTTFQRGEGFWKALELEFKELLAKALKERGEKTRCTHCGGTGIVGKGVEEPNDPWTRSPAL